MRKIASPFVCCVAVVFVGIVDQATAEEFYALVQKAENGEVTFIRREVGRGSRGMGRGGIRRGSVRPTTLPVADDIQVTTATYVRRTGDFRIGIPLGGGLRNSAIRALEPGALARIVTDGNRIVEMNVVIDDSDGTTTVAVPPRRPAPKK